MQDLRKLELRTDEDRRRMQQVVSARLRCDRLRTVRHAVAALVTVVAVPLWTEAGWPGFLTRRAVGLAFALFAALGILLVGTAAWEYTWYRRSERTCARRDHGHER